MICTNCGTETSDDIKFCPECGTKTEQKKLCGNCGAELQIEAKFCPECGTSVMALATPDTLAQQTDNLLTEKAAVELINYIQFSVAKIINGKSKGLLEDEFNSVINNINPTSLQDNELISAYEDLLDTLTQLKLNENQRENAKKMLQEKKKNAVTNCLNSFGSIFVPGINPVSLLASVAYTGASAALNYRRALNDAIIEGEENEFEINQSDLEYIDSLRKNLFIATARVFASRSNSVQGLISENEMKQFAEYVNKIYNDGRNEAQSALLFLETAEEDLKLFPPYWIARAAALLKTKKQNEVFEALEKFKSLIKDNPIFKKNPYAVESAKIHIEGNNLLLASTKEPNEELLSKIKQETLDCIETIKQNTQLIQTELDTMNFDFVQLYEMIGDFENAEKCIRYLEGRQLIGKNSRLKIQLKLLQDGKFKNPELVHLIEKAFSAAKFEIFDDLDNTGISEQELQKIIKSNNVFFLSANKENICTVIFSNGIDKFAPKIIKHELHKDTNQTYTLIEMEKFTWNNLAEHPHILIAFKEFNAYYEVSIVNPNDWDYSQRVNLNEKIRADISRLDTEEVCANFSTFDSKDALKLGAKIGGSAFALGLIGLGAATVASAKDIKRAFKSKGKEDLTWLIINLVEVEKNGNKIRLLSSDRSNILVDDLLCG